MVDDPARYRFEETLKDGTPVVLRAIRPDDRERVRNAFRKLERETIYTRFFGPKSELSDRELTQLTAVDFDRDVALLVTTRSNDEEIVRWIIAGIQFAAWRDDLVSLVSPSKS